MLIQNSDAPPTATPSRHDTAAHTIPAVLIDNTGTHHIHIATDDLDAVIRHELIGPWAEVCQAADSLDLWSARPGIGTQDTYLNDLATGLLRALILAVLSGDYPGNLDHPNMAADMLVFGFPPIVGPCLIIGTDDTGTPSRIPPQFVQWVQDLARSTHPADTTTVTVTSEDFDLQDEPPF